MKCDMLLYEKRFPLMLTGAVYKSYIMPAILSENEALSERKED